MQKWRKSESALSAPHLHWTLSGSETMHSRISGAEEHWRSVSFHAKQGKGKVFSVRAIDVSINCASVKLTTTHWPLSVERKVKKWFNCASLLGPLWTVRAVAIVVSSIIWSRSLTQRSDTCQSLWVNAVGVNAFHYCQLEVPPTCHWQLTLPDPANRCHNLSFCINFCGLFYFPWSLFNRF